MRIVKTLPITLVLILMLGASVTGQNRSNQPIPPLPKLLSQREQVEVREAWLKKRFDTVLLPMMKKHGVDMWIVVNEEFHSDPVTEFIVPPIPIVGRRDLFIFISHGDKLERYAIVRYEEERLKKFYTVMSPPVAETGAAIKKLIEERDPGTIALNF
jgi:Xaa-Pro dipeptidase